LSIGPAIIPHWRLQTTFTILGEYDPAGKGSSKPKGELASAIEREFGNFERFKKEFTQAAVSVEGSGWAALAFCMKTMRPIVMQIEKHNVNVYPGYPILMVLDVWEHAYYLDYKTIEPSLSKHSGML
jgi:Fe-Mn family superoxide dismutase